MIGILLKNWKSILDILLVIAAVVLIFIWNPFGIFGGGLKLSPTASMVTQVREIGQLVTSEYYGEVIASIEESRMNYLEEDQIANRAARLYEGLYETMVYLEQIQEQSAEVKEAGFSVTREINGKKKVLQNKVSRRNIVDKLSYYDLLEDISTEPLYEVVLEYLWRGNNLGNKWKGSSRNKEDVLMALYSEAEKGNESTFNEASFSEFYYQQKSLGANRKEKKKKLAMLGRGWVKAGFDFSKLDDNNFYINEDAGEVHFFGLSATILNSDINPWFIPELGIPGFEILDYNGKVDFRDAKKVKQYCVEKLILKAHEAEILKYAEANGADLMKHLFSLMTGKEITHIFFHNDPLLLLSQKIAEDEFVSYYEAVFFDSLINEERKLIDSLQTTRENSYKNKQVARHREESIRRTLGLLQELPFEDLPGNFNQFSQTTFEIARDSILDEEEWARLKTLRHTLSPASLDKSEYMDKFNRTDYLSQTAQYNGMIEYFITEGVVAGVGVDSILPKTTFSEQFLSETRMVDYNYIHKDTVHASFFVEEAIPGQRLINLLYPFHYDSISWEETLSQRNLIRDSIPLNKSEAVVFNDSTSLVYEALPYPHLKVLNISPEQWIEPLLLAAHSETGVLWISRNIAVLLNEGSMISFINAYKTSLTDTQSKEMELFYHYFLDHYSTYHNKGPMLRANEWVQKKLRNNDAFTKLSSGIKKRMIN